jgi:hypothetical protein
MALWRCPHCGTPQPVTARCWVCRRSSTSCGTCRHFRASVAARIGYCGLDRDRKPLAGDEIRACWVPAVPLMADGEATPATEREPEAVPLTGPLRLRGFVPVESVFADASEPPPAASPATPPPAPPPTIVASASPAVDGMLWADLES